MDSAAVFPLLGEPLSLDLVNTCVHRDGSDVDLLDAPSALDAWMHAQAGRLAWTGAANVDDWHATCALRDAMADLFRASMAHSHPRAESLKTVNGALALPDGRAQLTWTDGQAHIAPMPRRAQRGALLTALATDATQLLTGPDAGRLRKCANPDCVLLFVARNPRRRWCSSALCGNRMRVARHYVRHRGHA